MKITIDTNDVKDFLETLGNNRDEWYGPEDGITGQCIISFLDFCNKKDAVKELQPFVSQMFKD